MKTDTSIPQIVLLGASGFVGQAVLRVLAAQKDAVQVHALIHRNALPTQYSFVTVHTGSMTALPSELLPQAPHIIIHCASKQIDNDGSGFAQNLEGMESIGRILNPYTKAVLYASSYSVYGDGPQIGVSEQHAVKPESLLARSRADCEQRLADFAKAGRTQAVVFRTRFVVGNGDRFFLPGLAKLTRSGIEIASGEQRFSIIDVDHYAEVILGVARQILAGSWSGKAYEVCNVGYERPIALGEIQSILRDMALLPPRRLRIPVKERYLRLLEKLPFPKLRQFVHRLRLLGYDHYGSVQKLNTILNNSILQSDPRDALRKAVGFLAI